MQIEIRALMKSLILCTVSLLIAGNNVAHADAWDAYPGRVADAVMEEVRKNQFIYRFCDCCGTEPVLIRVDSAAVVPGDYGDDRVAVRVFGEALLTFHYKNGQVGSPRVMTQTTVNEIISLNYHFGFYPDLKWAIPFFKIIDYQEYGEGTCKGMLEYPGLYDIKKFPGFDNAYASWIDSLHTCVNDSVLDEPIDNCLTCSVLEELVYKSYRLSFKAEDYDIPQLYSVEVHRQPDDAYIGKINTFWPHDHSVDILEVVSITDSSCLIIGQSYDPIDYDEHWNRNSNYYGGKIWAAYWRLPLYLKEIRALSYSGDSENEDCIQEPSYRVEGDVLYLEIICAESGEPLEGAMVELKEIGKEVR